MKPMTYILTCMIAGLAAISCTETPDYREFRVPEIVSITSLPETHTARLVSDLDAVPHGSLEVGFYLGRDKNDLERIRTTLDGRSFSVTVEELEDGTLYWFKAYVSNGMNEVASGFESFMTDEAPVIPQEPVEPEDPENPVDPEDPVTPEDPVDPDEPTEPELPEDPVEPENPNFISFADPIVKEMCISAFDFDNDGAISYVEAAAVRDLSLMKLTSRTFTSFDELKYFTKLKEIPSKYFKNCTRLSSVTLPESIETISDEAFKNCTSLSRINIPEKLTSILRLAFEGCKSLKRVDISSLETLFRLDYGMDQPNYSIPMYYGASLYYNGSELHEITVPESITVIRQLALAGCANLKSLHIPGNVTSVGQQALSGCISLEEVTIHDDVGEFDIGVFDECTALKEIVLPKSLCEITEAMFLNCTSLQKVTIKEGVTMIAGNSFQGCGALKTVILTGTVPPSISEETFAYGIKFHVPAEAVDTYRESPVWSRHANNIKGF